MTSDDLARLASLMQERSQPGEEASYRIGPDDLLDIRIADLLEARSFSQGASAPSAAQGPAPVAGAPTFAEGDRVGANGEITLPLIGSVHAAGLTPMQLEDRISARLVSEGILRKPEVEVEIAEHRSRVVAVVGSVERPGTFPLTKSGATLADMIWVAGGPAKDAGRVVQFSPAGMDADDARTAASGTTMSDASPVLGGSAPGKPIRIDLHALLRPSGPGMASLNPPVRPGDVISVTAAGSVLVEGWVEKPGSYPVTPGLTLGGAVAAAGGSLYAADLEAVSVRRTLSAGHQRTLPVDLAAVSEGRTPDVPILDGDVITVPPSSAKVVPWGVWSVAREVIHVGASVPIF